MAEASSSSPSLAGRARARPGTMRLVDALGYRLPLAGWVSILHRASGALMFDSAAGTGNGAAAGPTPRFEGFSVVSLPGRLATLRLRSTPAFDAKWQSTSWLFLAGTFGASLLLAALLRQQATGRRRAEVLAQRMTVDARRLGLVASRTTNAVVITDLRRRITWVNEGFERITGYSAAEVIGRSPGAFSMTIGSSGVPERSGGISWSPALTERRRPQRCSPTSCVSAG